VTKKLHVSAIAERDLDDIWFYVATNSQSEERATRLIESIVKRLSVLAHAPKAGSKRDQIDVGLRGLPASDYIIYYRESEKYVVVSRIIHGSREQDVAFHEKAHL
jgi:plasmid stabilization system protein ParE